MALDATDSNSAPGLASAELLHGTFALAPEETRRDDADRHTQPSRRPARTDSAIESRDEASPPWVLAIIAQACVAETRTEAAQAVATDIKRCTAAAAVRVAWGKETPQRIVDTQQGVVATGDELFAEIARRWPQLAMQEESVQLPEALLLPLHEPSGVGRAVIIILDSGRDASAHSLAGSAHVIAAAFWSRPNRRSWAQWAARHLSRRWVLAALFALLALCLWPCHYRIACTALIEPVVQRVVAAPFEATLADCFVVPGDIVRAGQPLLVLDGRPLRIEFEALQAELQQAEKNEQMALATGRVADAQLAELDRRRLERRRALLEERLERLTICSPVSGVVLSGDHRRSIGSPFVTGQSLLEIAPLDQVTVEVEIPEYEIRYAKVGQPLQARLDAYRSNAIEGTLETLYPAAEIREDRNAFVGTVTIANSGGDLRPGMRGDAILYGPVRPLAWSWIRPLVEQGARLLGV